MYHNYAFCIFFYTLKEGSDSVQHNFAHVFCVCFTLSYPGDVGVVADFSKCLYARDRQPFQFVEFVKELRK
jgi:hypothetical protein